MKKTSLLAILLTLVLGACGGATAEEETDTTPVAQTEPAPEPEPEPEPEPQDVRIDGDHLTIDRHINFESGSETILADSNELLDHIAWVISHNEEMVSHLNIIGHTDLVGNDADNQSLSDRRAAAVAAALQERGVSITLDHTGAGESNPLCQEETEECNEQNRRVEFLIVTDTAGGEG
ncbi:MAG: OmpA family protein [Sandaracinaceae bacterium]